MESSSRAVLSPRRPEWNAQNGSHEALGRSRPLADIAMRGFEAQDISPKATIANLADIQDGASFTDEELAKLVLREMCRLALGPGDKRTKIMALGTVLKYTKPKPAERHASIAMTPEEWLRAAIVAGAATS
jgi:hypothetical protein